MDEKQTFEKIKQLVQKYELMSNPRDFFIVFSILKNHNPKTILEVGTGSGAWPLCLSELGLKACFTLIENFMYSEEGFTSYNNFWPNNKSELENHLRLNHLKDFDIFDKDVNKYHTDKKFDCVRIDLDSDYTTINRLINSVNDNGVLFLDDINKFHRLLYVIQRNDFYPIWVGEKESAWVNNKQLQNDIINSIKDINIKNLQLDLYEIANWKFLESYSDKWLSNFKNLKRNKK